MVDMHHIISDGTSMSLFTKEFMSLYKGTELPPLRLQYKDYSKWQNRERQGEAIKKQENYWLKQFQGEVPVLNLPTDYIRPIVQSFEGSTLDFTLSIEYSKALNDLALNTGTSLYMVLLTIYYALLAKLSGQEDIVIGTAIAGRRHADLDQIIGMLVNTLALRNYPGGGKTFKEFLYEVKVRALKAFENPDYQYEDLVEQIVVNRDTVRNPIFDTMFVMQNVDIPDIQLPGLKLTPYPYKNTTAKFDLVLLVSEVEEMLVCQFQYSTELFKETTSKRFIKYFLQVVSCIIADTRMKISGIEMISKEEKEQLLIDFNNTSVGYPKDKTIHLLFGEQAEKNPDNIAVIGKAQSKLRNALTYRELDAKSDRLASLLIEKGVRQGTIVGIMMERSLEMIIGILGILKSGGAYMPINPDYPLDQVKYVLEDSQASVLLTNTRDIENYSFTTLQHRQIPGFQPYLTVAPSPIRDFDALPFPDRSLVDYEKYHRYIGQSMAKNSISLQGTRGCPYNCAYCHNIWPKKHVARSAENIFSEVQLFYNMGVKRFAFIDDIFNLDKVNSARFFKLIIRNGLNLQLFFPSGLRGDLLTKEYIDLMVTAGTVSLALALETTSSRLQKMIGKNLDLEKLHENILYLCEKYPHVILELFTMHGFPTETEEEALLTLEFIKSVKWLHFPYISILRIYPGTDMAKLALENGISNETILKSADLALHKLPETLVFDKSFTLKYQADFLNEYFLSKERLLHVLPYQMKVLTEDEIVQKYNSYLPTEIYSFNQLLNFIGITREELGVEKCVDETKYIVPCLNEKMEKIFPKKTPSQDALRILLLDLSQYFSGESNMLYDVVEPPLGMMYLLTYLNQRFDSKINGRIAKSRIDFDNYEELKDLLDQFQPDVIGIRSLTFHRNFFHKSVALIRSWGFDVPIITGGPYATSGYTMILQDRNIDLVVRGEGEITLSEIIGAIIANNKKLPGDETLKEIPGIAFVPGGKISYNKLSWEILIMDELNRSLAKEPHENPGKVNQPSDLVYVIYTSGSTGKPKGAMIEHRNVASLMFHHKFPFDFKSSDVWTMFHSYSFDFSVWEMYGALLYGGKLIVIPKIVSQNSPRYLGVLKEQGVTILNQTPTAFYRLMDEEIGTPQKELNLRYVIFGGEALNPPKIKKWQEKYPLSKMINMFGITETTVHVTYKEMTGKELEFAASIIGRPLQTLHCYVMDRNMKLLPVGAPGELFVGGYGVGRGYLNRPELSKERFIKNPYKPDERLYRTGDLARLLENGEMEYLGRIDHQVKIRGFRVELGEIERQLMDQPPVKDAVVTISEHNTGDKRLIAYVVPDPELAFTVRKLLELEKKDRRNRLIYELQNGMTIHYLNKNERDFMYREIFQDHSYMKYGIQLEEGGCIFDVGANIGMFSLFVNQICKNAKIYTFEPIPPIFEVLTLNVSL